MRNKDGNAERGRGGMTQRGGGRTKESKGKLERLDGIKGLPRGNIPCRFRGNIVTIISIEFTKTGS